MDGQRDTMHNTLRYAIIMNTVHKNTPVRTQNWLSNHMTYLLIIMLTPSPISIQIPHTLFNIILLGAHAVQIMPRIYARQFTLVHIAKCHSTILWIMLSYFSMNWLHGNSMCINSRQLIRQCPYHLRAVKVRKGTVFINMIAQNKI